MEKCYTRKVKYLKIMTRCALHGMIAMVMCGMAVANTNHAQLLERKVTLKLNEVPLEAVLQALEQQTGVKFFYSREHVDLEEKVSVDAEDTSLKNVFDQLFGSRQIRYRVHERDSTVTLKRNKNTDETENDLFPDRSIRLPPLTLRASVSGIVIDAQTQQPMAGVNVIVKGTLKGTSTDSDGRYVIEVDNENDVLVFSFIGFKTEEISVGSRTVIDAALEEDIARLGEVTVSTGYWEVDKKYSTGNIVKITSKEIEGQPVNNPILALQGRVAGLNVEQVSGVPGGSFRNLQIRGQNSLRSDGNNPLIVIDGVPFPTQNNSNLSGSGIFPSPLNILNPADIESIEVLKDADATAIYGSLGANGVILIKTKGPSLNDINIDFNISTGIGQVRNRVALLDTENYLKIREEAFKNDGITPNGTNAPDLEVWDRSRYTDWQDKLIGGHATFFNSDLAISGGNELVKFTARGGYLKETTVFPGDFPYEKGSITLGSNLTSKNRKLNISFSTNFVKELSTLPISDLTSSALTLAPNAPSVYDEEGGLNWENGTWENPYAALLKEYESKGSSLITDINLNYEVFPNLKFIVRSGYNLLQSDITRTTPLSAYSPTSVPLGELQKFTGNTNTWIVEPQLNYAKEFNKEIRVDLLIGSTFRETVTSEILLQGSGFSSDAQIKNMKAATTIDLLTDVFNEYRYNAVYGRAGLVLREKYLVNLTSRRDGSSRFGPNNRFANFGAVGAAWIFSEENLLSGLPFLSFGKLKVSYGVTGNDQIGDYSYLSTYSTFSTPYQGVNPIVISRLANPDYQWELVRKGELGIEVGFFKDRVRLNSSYYQNRSSNQLVDYSLPKVTGFSSITANLNAVVENRGFEFELSTTNLVTKDFKWSTSFNVSIPKNNLARFPNLEGSSYANSYRLNEPLSVRLVYKYEGIQANGLYQFNDYDSDGVISNPNDAQFIVNSSRHYFGGFQNEIVYKGFSLNFLVQFVGQTRQDYKQAFGVPGRQGNQPVSVLDFWENPSQTTVQKFSTTSAASSAYSRYSFSDASFVDASFLRLKNISLAYNFPNKIVDKLKMENLRLLIQAQNVFTVTKYKYLDPETGYNLPPVTMVTIGAKLTY